MVSSLDGGWEIAAEALNKVLQLGCCKFLFGGLWVVENVSLHFSIIFSICLASFPGQSDPDVRSKVAKASSPSAGGSLPSNRASDGCGQGLSTRQMNEVIEVC